MAVSPLQVFRSNHPVIRFFASVELTVVLLIVIGIACIVGTLIPQAGSIGGSPESLYNLYVSRYGPRLHAIFNALSFYNLYYCGWFSALLLVLTVNMVVCSLRRLRWNRRQIGFQLTHLSIVFLLLGVLVGLNGQQGQMRISEGEESDTLSLGRPAKVANTLDQARQLTAELSGAGVPADVRLGFAIHLNDFELRRQSKPLDSILVQTARGGPVRSYNIAFQKSIGRAGGEPWDIEILETKPLRRLVSHVVESTSATAQPAAEIEFLAHDQPHTDWVFAGGPRQRRVLTEDFEIEYARCRTREQLDRLLAEKDIPTTTTPDSIAATWDQTGATTWPLRLGVEQPLAGTSLTVTVVRFVPHWMMDLQTKQIVSATAERKNPAIQVQVKQGAASELRWLFARNPAFHGQTKILGTALDLRFVEADLRRPNIVRLLASTDPKDRFVQRYRDGHLVETAPAEPGRSLFSSEGFEVRLARWLESAAIENRAEDDPEQFLARLRLRSRATGQAEEIELPSGEVQTRGPLRFLLQREYPIDQFISRVGVVEDGRTVLTKTVQMNDPLKYRGYTFYQSSYDAEAGAASRYTVLSVSRDPGVGFIYIGFGMLTVGLVVVFYVNPWLFRRRKEEEAA